MGGSRQRRLVWGIFGFSLRETHETAVSTVENPPSAAAWLSEPQLDQERTRHSPQSPPRGPQTPDASLSAAAQPARTPFGLPRSQRLNDGRIFLRARAEGSRVVCGCLILNSLPAATEGISRVGIVVSRKVGDAVQRSRARRLMRETFRLNQRRLTAPQEIVLVARPSIAGREQREVERDFLSALRRLGLLKNE